MAASSSSSPAKLMPYYAGSYVVPKTSGSVVITEVTSAGNLNNLPVGIYLVNFLQTDVDLTNPLNSAFMGTAILMVLASGTSTYSLSMGFTAGNVVGSGTLVNQVYMVVGSTTVTLNNSTGADSEVEWSICKMN